MAGHRPPTQTTPSSAVSRRRSRTRPLLRPGGRRCGGRLGRGAARAGGATPSSTPIFPTRPGAAAAPPGARRRPVARARQSWCWRCPIWRCRAAAVAVAPHRARAARRPAGPAAPVLHLPTWRGRWNGASTPTCWNCPANQGERRYRRDSLAEAIFADPRLAGPLAETLAPLGRAGGGSGLPGLA